MLRHVLKNDRFGISIRENVLNLIALGPPVERRYRKTCMLACPVERRGFPAVLQNCNQMVALAKTLLFQRTGNRENARLPLFIGQPEWAIDYRERARVALDDCGKALSQIEQRVTCYLYRMGRNSPALTSEGIGNEGEILRYRPLLATGETRDTA